MFHKVKDTQHTLWVSRKMCKDDHSVWVTVLRFCMLVTKCNQAFTPLEDLISQGCTFVIF